MVNLCHEDCDGWKNMVNFIYGVPHYALADYCVLCDVWYPKHVLLRCPCCNVLLRRGRTKFRLGEKEGRENSSEYIRKMIEKATEKGWTLLNPDIWKKILDYRLTHNIPIKS